MQAALYTYYIGVYCIYIINDDKLFIKTMYYTRYYINKIFYITCTATHMTIKTCVYLVSNLTVHIKTITFTFRCNNLFIYYTYTYLQSLNKLLSFYCAYRYMIK